MNINQVIKYPILSEKTYAQMQNGVYTFAVDPRTNKIEIKKAIEFIFDVKVGKINIANYDKKEKRVGKFQGYTSAVKKAIVYLSEGQINIFPDEAEVTDEPKKDEEAKVEAISTEPSEIEKKAAEKIAAKAEAKTEKDKASTK